MLQLRLRRYFVNIVDARSFRRMFRQPMTAAAPVENRRDASRAIYGA
jgi:hypothetical protein